MPRHQVDPQEPDPLTVEVIELIGAVVARYHEDYERAAAAAGLTAAQAKVLAVVARNPLPMRRLADMLGCEPSNATGAVDRLEARGLVERRPSPGDRRVKLAAATEAGERTAAELRLGLRFAREPLAALTAGQRTTLRDLLREILG